MIKLTPIFSLSEQYWGDSPPLDLVATPMPRRIGIGRNLTVPPSHITAHTGPYTAIQLVNLVLNTLILAIQASQNTH